MPEFEEVEDWRGDMTENWDLLGSAFFHLLYTIGNTFYSNTQLTCCWCYLHSLGKCGHPSCFPFDSPTSLPPTFPKCTYMSRMHYNCPIEMGMASGCCRIYLAGFGTKSTGCVLEVRRMKSESMQSPGSVWIQSMVWCAANSFHVNGSTPC